MPMIDVYASAGTFGDPNALAQRLAAALMRIEEVPELPMFRNNTAAFIHALPGGSIANSGPSFRVPAAAWIAARIRG